MMKPALPARPSRGAFSSRLSALLLAACAQLPPAIDPLPSWNDGFGQTGDRRLRAPDDRRRQPAVRAPAERIATFDQDGTLWVEQPMPR